MSRAGERFAAAAEDLVGSPFRLGGRDPITGLDCIGLVAASLEAIGLQIGPLPQYSLRQHDIGRFVELAKMAGLRIARKHALCGDVLLLRPSPDQHHLAIRLADNSIVHAHAELRRVVITPSPLPWPAIRCWRLA